MASGDDGDDPIIEEVCLARHNSFGETSLMINVFIFEYAH